MIPSPYPLRDDRPPGHDERDGDQRWSHSAAILAILRPRHNRESLDLLSF
jgi:hypothetical protein